MLRQAGQSPQSLRLIEIADDLDDTESLQCRIALANQSQYTIAMEQARQGAAGNVAAADDQ
jgi:hypothetical protein